MSTLDRPPPPPPGFGPLTGPLNLGPAAPLDTLPWPNPFDHGPLDDTDLANNSEAFLEMFLDDELSETRERESYYTGTCIVDSAPN